MYPEVAWSRHLTNWKRPFDCSFPFGAVIDRNTATFVFVRDFVEIRCNETDDGFEARDRPRRVITGTLSMLRWIVSTRFLIK